MLEQRVAALETDMREVKATLSRIELLLQGLVEQVQRLDKRMDSLDERLRRTEVESAEAKGRLSQLPTAWTYMTTGFGLILATFGFTFAVLRFVIPHP